ncbi:MAG: siphovirus Gp157 family protein, partial [Chloroflexi bacterium]|nr:siphovirus Gp157 family protein [Chloroflexota bacterium]
MAESIGALHVEISASTARFEADMGKARSAVANMQRSFGSLATEVEISRRTMSAASQEVRFLAVNFISKLDPALGGAASQLASLSSVASATGGTLASVAGVAGVGALLAGLGLLAAELIKASKEAEEFQKALRDFDIDKAEQGLHKLTAELQRLDNVQRGFDKRSWLDLIASIGFGAEGISVEGVTIADQLETIREEVEKGSEAVATMQKDRKAHADAIQAETDRLKAQEEALKAHNQLLQEMARLEESATERATKLGEAQIGAFMARRERVFLETRTEAEKFQASLEELNRLMLDAETHARAVEQLEQAWSRAAGSLDEFKPKQDEVNAGM